MLLASFQKNRETRGNNDFTGTSANTVPHCPIPLLHYLLPSPGLHRAVAPSGADASPFSRQRASFHTYPTVHRQVRAGGETAVIAGKERDSSGDIFRLSDAAKRRHGGDTLFLLGRHT